MDAISPFELVQNSVEVSHDGRITDEQFRGDLGVVASCDDTIGHRTFTRSAQLNVMWICDVPAGRLHERLDQSHRDFRRHLRTAVRCRTDADRADLEHVRAGAGLADLRSVRRYIVSAEEPAEVPTNPAPKQT